MKRIYKLLSTIALGLGLVFAITLFLQSLTVAAQATPDRSAVIQAGLSYLRAQQQADGGITGFSGVSDPDTTARSVLAFVSAGEPISQVASADGNTLGDYLATQAISFTHDTTGTLFPGRAGILLSAVAVAGENPSDFGGMDLLGELDNSFQPDTGAYSTTAKQDYSSGQASDLNQAWAVLGLGLAHQKVPGESVQYLVKSQGQDGSWGFSDPDTTALAVTALLASHQVGAKDTSIQNALGFFHTTQLDNGGWKPSWDTDPLNADSTGWILQALVTAGEDPTSESWTKNGTNPVDALLGLQKEDGSIGGTYANTYSTAEAIIGLSGVSLAGQSATPVSQRAGLAVFPGDGTVITSCVTFTETNITGLDLLQRSGLTLETATNPTQGTAVCKVENVGCPASDCFCKMPDYWSYWQQGVNGWEYSALGAVQSQVNDGGVNAWSWGSGNPPPQITFQNICEGVAFQMPAATATAVSSTDTPAPTTFSSTDTPSVPPTVTAATVTQTTSTASTSPANLGTYVVYGLIALVFVVLFVYLLRSRKK